MIVGFLLAIASIAVVLAALLASRAMYHKNFPQEHSSFDPASDFVIQVDDYGSFWDKEVPARALKRIADDSQSKNTIVALFIHGWHHNANADDENARDFAKSLRMIRQKLDDNVNGKPGIYRQSRLSLTDIGDVTVIGIYVGWRGKSLPMPLNYLTFWGRKATAERVGDGDLREFLLRLNRIYLERNAPRAENSKRPFMGMISFGHSFGGQALFKAVSSTIESELIAATSNVDGTQRVRLPTPLKGFGDMTVLINPALEAFQYQRIHSLNKLVAYDRRQTPLLLVLSSETDFARQIFFPLGRTINAMFRAPFRANQRDQWTQALGEYEPQRTHSVEILQEAPAKFDPAIYIDNKCGIVNFDLTDVPAIGGVRLVPTANRTDKFSPFLVAYASGKVVLRHSGIFEDRLREFLNDYIAIAEGKRILLADPQAKECPQENATLPPAN
jgi:hypothetical protein